MSSILGYLGQHPEALEFLRESPARITLTSEEFFRAFMPLTHIGRVCPVETNVHGIAVPPNGRVSLCWASANQDDTVSEKPEEVRLERKPNPHVSFGFGTHLCLGAPHARLLIRTLLRKYVDRVAGITILEATERVENEAAYQRTNGYESLTVRFMPSI